MGPPLDAGQILDTGYWILDKEKTIRGSGTPSSGRTSLIKRLCGYRESSIE
jgi:hypothetical protein